MVKPSGFLIAVRTGTIHRGRGNAPSCNHSGSRRMPSCREIPAANAERVSETKFCRRCFPNGKPAIIIPEFD
jgi:hypothetical protein